MKSVSFQRQFKKEHIPSKSIVRKEHEQLLVQEIQKRASVLKPHLFSDKGVEVLK